MVLIEEQQQENGTMDDDQSPFDLDEAERIYQSEKDKARTFDEIMQEHLEAARKAVRENRPPENIWQALCILRGKM